MKKLRVFVTSPFSMEIYKKQKGFIGTFAQKYNWIKLLKLRKKLTLKS
jgi:hypothetical protein